METNNSRIKSNGVNFIVLAAGRSGSTLLVNSLSNHPSVRCHHEPFNQHGWHSDLLHTKQPAEALDYIDKKGLSIPLYLKIYSFIQTFVGKSKGKIVVDPFKNRNSISNEGFKITWAQAASMIQSLESWLSNKQQMNCLFLYRYDYLSRFVSYQIARKSGVWNSSHKNIAPESFKVSQKALQDFFDTEVEKEIQLLQMLASAKVNLSPLSYEDLVSKPLEVVNDQLAFLGCQPIPKIKLFTQKVISKPLEKIVSNIEDLPIEELNKYGHEQRLALLKKI